MAGVFAQVIELAIEAETRTDQEKLWVAIQMMAAVDDRIGFVIDREIGQAILKGGPDEDTFAGIIDRLRHNLNFKLNIGAPQVAYRETPRRRAEIDYTYKRQSGGSGQFARVKLILEPRLGDGFESTIVDGSVPLEFIPGIKKGVAVGREAGVIAGFPVIDLKVTLVDGAYHDVDSSVLAFELCARAALKEGLRKAECQLLEPVMKVDIAMPLGYAGEIIADLQTRRAEYHDLETRGGIHLVHALVPLANMFGYSNTLKSLTSGQAAHKMVFAHYSPVPQWPDDDPFHPAVGMRA